MLTPDTSSADDRPTATHPLSFHTTRGKNFARTFTHPNCTMPARFPAFQAQLDMQVGAGACLKGAACIHAACGMRHDEPACMHGCSHACTTHRPMAKCMHLPPFPQAAHDPAKIYEPKIWGQIIRGEPYRLYPGCALDKTCYCEADVHCGRGMACVAAEAFPDLKVCKPDW